jgi:hypothetical protein
MGKHGFTRLTTARTWGKPPPSPLQYFFCLATGPAPKCHLVLGLPSGSLEIPKIKTPLTLEAHNFVCKPLIEVRFEAKLYSLLKAFQWCVTLHLHIRELDVNPFKTFTFQELFNDINNFLIQSFLTFAITL